MIALTKRTLVSALRFVCATIPTRSSHPILTAVRLDVTPGAVTFSGTSLEADVFAVAPAETGAAFSCLVPAHLLHEISKTLPDLLAEFSYTPARQEVNGRGDPYTVPGVLNLRAGSFEVALNACDLDAAPVLTRPALVAGEGVPVPEVRAALGAVKSTGYEHWQRRGHFIGSRLASCDGERIAQRDVRAAGLDGVSVGGAELLGVLSGLDVGAAVTLGAGGELGTDEAAVIVAAEVRGVQFSARVRGTRHGGAPEQLRGIVGDLGPALGTLPGLVRRTVAKSGAVTVKPWTLAQGRAAERAADLAVWAVLPDGTYEGFSEDGGRIWSEQGAGVGLADRVAVFPPEALRLVVTGGASLHESPELGRTVYRAGGTVGVLGVTCRHGRGVTLPGLVTRAEWDTVRADLRRAFYADQVADLCRALSAALYVAPDDRGARRLEAGPVLAVADRVADVLTAAAGEGFTFPDARADLLTAAADVLRGVRADRDSRRSRFARTLGAYYAADLAAVQGNEQAAAADVLKKDGTPKRRPAAVVKALAALDLTRHRAGEAVRGAFEDWRAAALHAARVADVVALLSQGERPIMAEVTARGRFEPLERAVNAPGALAARSVRHRARAALAADAAADVRRRVPVQSEPAPEAAPVPEVVTVPEVAAVLNEYRAALPAVHLCRDDVGAAGVVPEQWRAGWVPAFLGCLLGVEARRAALVPFPGRGPDLDPARVVVRPAGARIVGRVRAGVPAVRGAACWTLGARWGRALRAVHLGAVLGALEALADVPRGELLTLGAAVGSGDPAALEAGRAAAVVLAALRGPWRGRVVQGVAEPVTVGVSDTAPGVPVGGGGGLVVPSDTAPGVPEFVERTVQGSHGWLLVRVFPDSRVMIRTKNTDYHGHIDARGVLNCAGTWRMVAGRKVLEVRGAALELARELGVAA